MKRMFLSLVLGLACSVAVAQETPRLAVVVDFVDHKGVLSPMAEGTVTPRAEGNFFYEHTEVFDSQVLPQPEGVVVKVEPFTTAFKHVMAVETDMSFVAGIQVHGQHTQLIPNQYTVGTRMEARWVKGVAVVDVLVRQNHAAQHMTYNTTTKWQVPVVQETALAVTFDPAKTSETFEFPTPKGTWRVHVRPAEAPSTL